MLYDLLAMGRRVMRDLRLSRKGLRGLVHKRHYPALG